MEFETPLREARLLRRYKRFLADVAFDSGEVTTVHCPNPGAMLGVAPVGARCWISLSTNKTRKLPGTLEIVECDGPDGTAMVGINTHRPNRLAEEAITAGRVPGVPAAAPLKREVRYGSERSRIDILMTPAESAPIYVEVKNCHLLRRNDGIAEFPDCVTLRGQKHLRELSGVVSAGARAVLLFVVQRGDATAVAPADDLDPAYGMALRDAASAGVEVLAVRCDVTTTGINATAPIPVVLDQLVR